MSNKFEITYTSQYISQTFATSNDRLTNVALCYNHPLSNSGRKWSTWEALCHLVSLIFSNNRDCSFQVPLWFKERNVLSRPLTFFIFFDHDYFSHFFFCLTLASFSLFSHLVSSPCLLVESPCGNLLRLLLQISLSLSVNWFIELHVSLSSEPFSHIHSPISCASYRTFVPLPPSSIFLMR